MTASEENMYKVTTEKQEEIEKLKETVKHLQTECDESKLEHKTQVSIFNIDFRSYF